MNMEAQLITQAKGGNNDAFSKLVNLYGRRIYYAAYSFLHNVDDAADIVQEVFLRAYKNLSSFDTKRSFYPWLYRIARNLCINTVKRASRRDTALPAEELIASNGPDPAAELVRSEEIKELHEALDKLPEKQREIINLKTFQDCSYAEMAEILDIPIGTVMSRLYSARLRLKELLMEVNT
jgi:RNA polymerase sigma-70 factor (ECF subfamily)